MLLGFRHSVAQRTLYIVWAMGLRRDTAACQTCPTALFEWSKLRCFQLPGEVTRARDTCCTVQGDLVGIIEP